MYKSSEREKALLVYHAIFCDMLLRENYINKKH